MELKKFNNLKFSKRWEDHGVKNKKTYKRICMYLLCFVRYDISHSFFYHHIEIKIDSNNIYYCCLIEYYGHLQDLLLYFLKIKYEQVVIFDCDKDPKLLY